MKSTHIIGTKKIDLDISIELDSKICRVSHLQRINKKLLGNNLVIKSMIFYLDILYTKYIYIIDNSS